MPPDWIFRSKNVDTLLTQRKMRLKKKIREESNKLILNQDNAKRFILIVLFIFYFVIFINSTADVQVLPWKSFI